jgi:hypothetical protein
MTDSASEIEYAPLPQDDPRRRRPNISLAIRELQWRPTVDLEVGLARTIGHFRRQFAIERVPSGPPAPRLPRTTKRTRGAKRKSAPLAPA